MKEAALQINLTLGDIYQVLCPACREKLLTVAAQSGTMDIIKKQLEEQCKKEGK